MNVRWGSRDISLECNCRLNLYISQKSNANGQHLVSQISSWHFRLSSIENAHACDNRTWAMLAMFKEMIKLRTRWFEVVAVLGE